MTTKHRGNGAGSVYKRQARRPYYIAWYDHDGKRCVRCSGTTDKLAAERILQKYLSGVAQRQHGVIDARQEAIAQESCRPIDAQFAAYEAHMKAPGRDAHYVATTLRYIRETAKKSGWCTVGDIIADDVTAYAEAMEKAG